MGESDKFVAVGVAIISHVEAQHFSTRLFFTENCLIPAFFGEFKIFRSKLCVSLYCKFVIFIILITCLIDNLLML